LGAFRHGGLRGIEFGEARSVLQHRGIPEIVDESVGFLAEPKNAADFAGKILKVLRDEKKARGMGAEGRKLVLRRFTWEQTARGYEEFYSKLAP